MTTRLIEYMATRRVAWRIALAILGMASNATSLAETTTTMPTKTSADEATVALDDAWSQARADLIAGKDADACRVATKAIDDDARPSVSRDRLRLFVAVSDRSYFGGRTARAGLDRMRDLVKDGANSDYQRAAAIALAIEARDQVNVKFDALVALATVGDDETILWLAGIEARTLRENERGAKLYGRLLEKLGGTGPAIVHQTYANLLDSLERFDDALDQRQLSIAAGPASWNYNGMGNTLESLHRYDEADAAFAEAMRRAPDDALNVINRARNATTAGHPENAIVLAVRAIELAPQDPRAWFQQGRASRALKDWPTAEKAFRQAITLGDTNGKWSARYLAEALDAQGRSADAAAIREKYHVEP